MIIQLCGKVRYIVPVINPTKAYVTNFENIDISVGFSNYEEIKKYLGTPEGQELDYDYALIDIDSVENFENFDIKKAENKYFVTSFDLYSLKKGLEILRALPEPTELTKILFAKDILKEEDEYLNYLALETKAVWNKDYKIYLPVDIGDYQAIIENQRVSKITIRKLSPQYKEGLQIVVADIAKDVTPQEIRRIFKVLEREVW